MADSKKEKAQANNKSSASAGKKSSKTSKSAGSKGGSKGSKAASSSTGKKTKAAMSEEKAKQIAKEAEKAAGTRLRDEVTAIVLIALGIFLVLSVLSTMTGAVGEVIALLLRGSFGHMGMVLPFYLIVYALLVLMNRMAHINSRTVFFTILTFIDLTMLNSVRFLEVKTDSFGFSYIGRMFQTGYTLESAGAVGMTLGCLLVKAVDIAGLVIIGIVILIVSLLLMVNTPISTFFDDRRIAKAAFIKHREHMENESNASEEEQLELDLTGAAPQPAIEASPKPQLAAPAREAGKKEAAKPKPGDHTDLENLKIRPTGLGNTAHTDSGHYISNEYGQLDGPERPLTENKRQILEFMNDDNLFSHDDLGIYTEESHIKTGDTVILTTHGEPAADVAATGIAGAKAAEKAMEIAAHRPAAEHKPSAPDTLHSPSVNKAESAKSSAADSAAPADDFTAKAMEAAANNGDAKKLSKAEAKAVMEEGAALVGAEIKENEAEKKQYVLPPLDLLRNVEKKISLDEEHILAEKAERLEQVLKDFGVNARVLDVKKGPSVTRYEIQPATGVKVNSIVRLADDIALNLEAKSLRIEAPIPGKAAIGIEVENDSSVVVSLREMIDSPEFDKSQSKISFVVGENISGDHIVSDLKGMPHLLIAGSTGSGKSVCINSIIMSMLYKSTPDEVRFILIDPKVVELGNYNGIPHMLIPVVTDPSKAAAALAWAVQEMNDRYNKFAETACRDLKSYNEKMAKDGQPEKVLPQIVIIIDELADLMMAAAKQVEESICRLAQLARAAGMHLIVATQRPSVDVVTGLIKANIPSRIAFAVSSQVDSRTILDRAGAEKLVGKGDMLFNPLGKAQPERLQGPFVTDDEVNAVIDFWKAQADGADNGAKIMEAINSSLKTEYIETEDDEEDELMGDAIDLVLNAGQASASMLQRRFRIGYNRAGRLIDLMEARGIIGQSEGSKPRKVLISKEEYYYDGSTGDYGGYADEEYPVEEVAINDYGQLEYAENASEAEYSEMNTEAEYSEMNAEGEFTDNNSEPEASEPTSEEEYTDNNSDIEYSNINTSE